MSGDFISRQDALKRLKDFANDDMTSTAKAVGADYCMDIIKAMPGAGQEWIPVSERWPENKSYVLTTIHVPGRSPHSRSGWFEDGLFMNDNGDTWKCTDREVIAWMPLPEPYGGEK